MKQLLYFFSLIVILTSCQQTSQKLRLAEEIIETQPDSALKVLREIDYQNEKSDRNKALYGILMFKALDKNYLSLTPDSLINFSIKFYQDKNDKEKLGEALFYKGRMYNYVYQYENATKLYMFALDNLKGSQEYNLLAKIYSDLARISVVQGDFKNAREKFQKTIVCFHLDGDSTDACFVKMDIGNTFRTERKFNEAHEIYIDILKNSDDSLLTGIALQEIGINFFWHNKFDSALSYLKKSIKYPHTAFYNSIRLLRLADTYYELNRHDSAMYFAKMSLEFPGNFYTKRECYRILANTCYLKKDFKSMAEYMTHYQAMTDSVSKIQAQTKAIVIEEVHQSAIKAVKKSNQIYWLIAVIILSLGIVFFISYRLIRKNRTISKQKKVVENTLSNKKSEIEQNKTMLRESMKDLIEKNKALKSNGKKNADILLSDETVLEIYTQALQINNYEVFSQKINAAYNNMICDLAIKFPAISQKEMFYCSFILLDIPQNHAMVLLETTPNGLYKIRQRLAQKLELNSTRELDDFLKICFGH
jgi:tetratricopeptide (TPR) repeat protein